MLSAGMLFCFASAMIVRRRGFESGSPPPLREATVNSLMRRVNTFPRLASAAPFLCLIECHLEWPDMVKTPAISTRSDSNLTTRFSEGGWRLGAALDPLPRDDQPRFGALVPPTATVVAEHRVDLESGPLDSGGQLPDGQSAKRQLEPVLGRAAAVTMHISLLECG